MSIHKHLTGFKDISSRDLPETFGIFLVSDIVDGEAVPLHINFASNIKESAKSLGFRASSRKGLIYQILKTTDTQKASRLVELLSPLHILAHSDH